MHFYVIDDFLSDKRYEAALNRIQARLTEIGIQGRMERLTILKNVTEVIEEAVRRGADTIVAIGDDRTISKMISTVARQNLPFGIIPVGPHQTIARSIGLPDGAEACETLSRRVVENVDLGKAGDRYFLVSLDLPESNYRLECDGQYRISTEQAESLSVRNLSRDSSHHNPKDGILEAVIGEGRRGMFSGFFRRASEPSIFPFKRLTITAETPLALLLDGQIVLKTPVTVEATPRKLKLIVGKERQF